jgi:hypothetical protein
MDWIDLAQDRDGWRAVVSAGNFLTSRGSIGFSRRTQLHGVSWLVGSIYSLSSVRVKSAHDEIASIREHFPLPAAFSLAQEIKFRLK